jgi:L-lactate utilization protein LutC
MTAVTKIEPNPKFGVLASDKRVAKAAKALEANGFKVVVVDKGEDAARLVLAAIPEGAEVLVALSETLNQIGVTKAIDESGRYDAIRPKAAKLDRKTQAREIRKLRGSPDYIVGSVHAITEGGELVIASGSGSQIGPEAYSARRVILVAGTQKIVRNVAEALRRIEDYSLPLENERMVKVYGYPSLLAKILLIKREPNAERITIVLVKEKLGF